MTVEKRGPLPEASCVTVHMMIFSGNFEIEFMALGAEIFRLLVLMVAGIAVKRIPVVWGCVGVFRLDPCRLFDKPVRIVTCYACIHGYRFLFLSLSMAFCAGYAR